MWLFEYLDKEATKNKDEPITEIVFGGKLWSSGNFSV